MPQTSPATDQKRPDRPGDEPSSLARGGRGSVMVLLPKKVSRPSRYRGPKPRSLPGPPSGIWSLGTGLLGGEVAVFALDAGDEVLTGGKTKEDRNDAQGYRRDREPAGAEVVAYDTQQNPDGLHRHAGRGGEARKERGNEPHQAQEYAHDGHDQRKERLRRLLALFVFARAWLLLSNPLLLSLNPRLLLVSLCNEQRDCTREALV
jgi:hypothetical protein